jgi:hypothetical protein
MLASADAVEIGGIYYNLDNEAKAAEVTSNPNQHEGSDYEAMTAGATSSPNQYEGDVTIPESVTYDVVVYSVTSIGDGAFRSCSGLTSITIPSSVTSIGELAFSGCSGLTSVTIPNSVTSIGWAAFDGCSGLTSITFGNGVISIGDFAFSGCTSLTSITIPSSVTSIGTHPFFDCSGLQSIVIEKGNTVYDSREDCNAIIKTSDNELISGCTNSTIPNSVTKIGQSAFQNCKGLRSVRIPNSVVSVGQNAFQNCSGMTSITIPNSVTSIGSYAFRWCSGLTSITIPNSVTSIDEFVFYECSGLTSVTIPNSVTSIGRYAFDGCSDLTAVTIPNSVTFIEQGAFFRCRGLTAVSIGSGTITICDQVFACCPELTDVYCYAKSVPYTYADSYSNAFKDSSIEYATLHVPAASVSAYQAVEPWKNFKEIVALSTQEDDTDDANYLPFVEGGKQWHVVRSDNDSGCHLENYMMNEEAVKDGKTYIKMSRSEDDLDVIYDTGLFREEDRKIYIFDDERQEEHLMFDYSLKEGDTYETFSYDEEKMVTYKVLSVDDYTEGPQVRREVYDEKTGNLITHSRYLQKWTVCRTDDNSIQKTWIEGVGSLEGPLENLHDVVLPDLSKDYLAYVEKYSGYLYLPFSFYDTLNKQAHGCDLPTSESNKEYDDELNHLTYELEGDRLHVYGEVFGNCGPNQYAYFYEKPTDDPLVHRIEFEIQEVEPLYWCKGLYATDFYVPGSFDPNINYIVVDNNGEEHPVINKTQQMAYRPFVEDGKVWKVGSTMIRDNLVKMVEYYYFDGDTIIDGKTCKQMMCQRYVNPEYPDYAIVMQYPLLQYVGAWYEENKKVYLYNAIGNKMLMYDFSFDDYATLQIHGQSYVIGPKQAGGMKGFKGVYRDVMMLWDEEQNIYNTTWLEGVGGIDGPTVSVYLGEENHALFLMSCTVGDEVIYLIDGVEDVATPAEARKKRFDFTHTIKTKPKSRTRSEEDQSLYGEYNEQQLSIHLDPIDDTYLVCITDESGKAVYEKEINAGSIVGLNIDISAYPEGRYTVTVENSQETFTGEFDTQTTGIEVVRNKKEVVDDHIYNLQGQRLSTLQKGLNIVNGQKVYVK